MFHQNMTSKPSPTSPDNLTNGLSQAHSLSEANTDLDQADSLPLGALLITAGFLANTIQGALGKTAQAAIEPGQFLWLLIVIAFAVLLPIEIAKGGRNFSAGWNREVLPYYLLRAVFGLGGFYLFIWAAGLGSLINANVLLNTTPVFIPVIGVLVLGKDISRKLWGAIALGFIGLLLVVQPSADLLSNPANLLGLGAGVSAAIEFLIVRYLSQTQSPTGLTLYYLLIGSILIAPVAIWQWRPLTLETLEIVAAAAGSFLSFQLLLVQAYRYAEPHQIGVFQYTSVIFAAIIGWLFFSEVPNILSVTGMVLISIGGALSIYLPESPA
ncbi:Integral membrane protein DUF6 [Synechococcus sp. PCC 7335]|nr:Integral membrane protein DUF6 [Synechococcus sp. PCC 7335]